MLKKLHYIKLQSTFGNVLQMLLLFTQAVFVFFVGVHSVDDDSRFDFVASRRLVSRLAVLLYVQVDGFLDGIHALEGKIGLFFYIACVKQCVGKKRKACRRQRFPPCFFVDTCRGKHRLCLFARQLEEVDKVVFKRFSSV